MACSSFKCTVNYFPYTNGSLVRTNLFQLYYAQLLEKLLKSGKEECWNNLPFTLEINPAHFHTVGFRRILGCKRGLIMYSMGPI